MFGLVEAHAGKARAHDSTEAAHCALSAPWINSDDEVEAEPGST